MEFQLLDVLYLISVFLGLLTGVLLLLYGSKKNSPNGLLGISSLLLAVSAFIIWLVISKNYIYFPWLYRKGNLAGLLYIPLMYLYIRNSVKGSRLGPWDLLHLIPSVLFVVDHWPIYLLDRYEVIKLINLEIETPSLFTSFSQSRFFPDNFYTVFRSLLMAGYWMASFRLVRLNWETRQKGPYSKEWTVWISLFLILELPVFLPFVFLFWIVDAELGFHLTYSTVFILNFCTAVSLFFFPKILYGLNLNAFDSQVIKKATSATNEERENLPGEKLDEVRVQMDLVLKKNKRYLQLGYSIHDLAQDTGLPAYILTIYLNQTLGVNFSEHINRLRIEECCRMIKTGKYSHLTVEGLAEKCGFNNRNSFSAAFKNVMGVSPSSFLKSVKLGK